MDKTDVIISHINKVSPPQKAVIAIDGRCASGKTTLAGYVGKRVDCNIVHMDDFFLQPHQRTEERLSEPGGNIDYERFVTELLQPIKRGGDFSWRPYNCHTASFGEAIRFNPCKPTVVEGSYACHPKFFSFYDYCFFLDVDSDEQLRRISARNGEVMLEKFKNLWIPMEEMYFREFGIKEKCISLNIYD